MNVTTNPQGRKVEMQQAEEQRLKDAVVEAAMYEYWCRGQINLDGGTQTEVFVAWGQAVYNVKEACRALSDYRESHK